MHSASNHYKKLKIIILGYIVRGPLGGMSWHHLQYFLGLERMGCEVYFLEDSGDTEYSCYNPINNSTSPDPGFGLEYANDLFKTFHLDNKWAYYDRHSEKWHGPLVANVHSLLKNAELLINISGSNVMRPWMMNIPFRVMLDTDPVFTQIRNLTDPSRKQLTDLHNFFFSFGENIGADFCTIPDDGIKWKPTRQPVVPGIWQSAPPASQESKWTTVLQWDSYKTQSFAGIEYGMKSISFDEYYKLPQLTNDSLELAIGSPTAPHQKLKSEGWDLANPLEVTLSPENYRDYIFQSKGEWSIAKHGYVTTTSGWFSERSANYLACGRPVIVQDTGFSNLMETGNGLLCFSSLEESVEQLKMVNMDFRHHCKSAKKIIEEYFRYDKVLNQLLNEVLD
jgi:hypothetical protein